MIVARLLRLSVPAVLGLGCGALGACAAKSAEQVAAPAEVQVDTAIVRELERIRVVDQTAAYIPQGKYESYTQDEWEGFKDSAFTVHKRWAEDILRERGFLGYDQVGEEGSSTFWLIVQHADQDPDFQRLVLASMKGEVERGNADPGSYAMLVDRVALNTGGKQVYGSQVAYHTSICQAYAKDLADSASVDERRAAVGLEPLAEYLNMMTQGHFEMNKESYVSEGITAPRLYPIAAAEYRGAGMTPDTARAGP